MRETMENEKYPNKLPREEEIFKVPENLLHYDKAKYNAQAELVRAAKETTHFYEERGIEPSIIQSDGLGTKVDVYKRASEVLPEKERVLTNAVLCLGASILDDHLVKGTIPKDMCVIFDINNPSSEIGKMLGNGYRILCNISRIPINYEGSEIANMDQVKSMLLNGSAIGCDPDLRKLIDKTRIKPGQILIGCQEASFRANGFTPIRQILEKQFGKDYHTKLKHEFLRELIAHSTIYTPCIGLHLMGDHNENPRLIQNDGKCAITGVAHITGQGIPGKCGNMLKGTGYGMFIDNPFNPPPAMLQIQQWGNVSAEKFYITWHGGTGLVFSVEEKYVNSALSLIEEYNNEIEKERARQFNEEHPECPRLPQRVNARIIGEVIDTKKGKDPRIIINNRTLDKKPNQQYLEFPIKQ